MAYTFDAVDANKKDDDEDRGGFRFDFKSPGTDNAVHPTYNTVPDTGGPKEEERWEPPDTGGEGQKEEERWEGPDTGDDDHGGEQALKYEAPEVITAEAAKETEEAAKQEQKEEKPIIYETGPKTNADTTPKVTISQEEDAEKDQNGIINANAWMKPETTEEVRTTPKDNGYVPTNLLRMEGQPASNGGTNYAWNGQIRNVVNDNGQIRDTLLYGNQTAGVDPAKAAAQEAARKQFEAAFGYDPRTADNNLVSAENFAREQLEQKLAQQQAQQEALKKQEEFLANWNPNPDVMAAVAEQGQAYRDEYNRRAEAERKQAEFLENWNPDQATLQYLGSQGDAIKQTLEEREKRDQRNAAFDEAREAQKELPEPQVVDKNIENRNAEFDAARKEQKNLPDPQVIDRNKKGGVNDKLDDIMEGGKTVPEKTGSLGDTNVNKNGDNSGSKIPKGSEYFRPSYGQDMEKGVKAPYRKGGYTADEIEAMGNKARSDWKYYNGNKAYEGYYLAPDGHYYPVDQIKANYYRQNGSYSGWQEGMRDYWNTFGTFYGYRPNWQQTGRGGGGSRSGGGGGSRGYSYSGGNGNGSSDTGYYWNGNTSWSI